MLASAVEGGLVEDAASAANETQAEQLWLLRDSVAAAERDKRPLTKHQRRVWSANMGHETEQITETHYGKLSNEECIEVMRNIGFDQQEAVATGYTREQMHTALDAVLDTLDVR